MKTKSMSILGFGVLLLGLNHCASRRPDYSIFGHLLEKRPLTSAPNLALYPDLTKKLPPRKQEPVSWAGLLTKIHPKRDKQGRVVLQIQHRHIAVDSAALRNDNQDVRFMMSEVSGGLFECRIPFKESPRLDEWTPYLDKQKILGCTGPLVGFTTSGIPVVQGELLEAMKVEQVSGFAPSFEKATGRIVLDDFGRPKFEMRAQGATVQLK